MSGYTDPSSPISHMLEANGDTPQGTNDTIQQLNQQVTNDNSLHINMSGFPPQELV